MDQNLDVGNEEAGAINDGTSQDQATATRGDTTEPGLFVFCLITI